MPNRATEPVRTVGQVMNLVREVDPNSSPATSRQSRRLYPTSRRAGHARMLSLCPGHPIQPRALAVVWTYVTRGTCSVRFQ